MPRPTISVLMSTYSRETHRRLQKSLESMFSQTLVPDQLVLVVDGPIPDEQESVIAQYSQDTRLQDLRIVRLEQNVGLGAALNAGLGHCTGEWIMRMDSDDVSVPERTHLQVEHIQANPNTDVVAGYGEEFFEDWPETRIKTTPLEHDEIVHMLRYRNIIVHPSVTIRAEMLRKVSGYRGSFHLLEDWDLWVRMALAGGRFGAVPAVVIRVLVGDQPVRRGGWAYVRNEINFRTFMWRSGFVPFPEYAAGTAAYAGFRLMPSTIRGYLYRFVRKNAARIQ